MKRAQNIMDAQDQIIRNNFNQIFQKVNDSSLSLVRVIAVTKYAHVEWVKSLLKVGITDIAENQVQQGIQRYEVLKSENYQFTYHYIGPIQTNKIRQIISVFDWVQTICRLKEVDEFGNEWQKLVNKQYREKINCCIQINIGNEPQKNGLPANLAEITTLAEKIINSDCLQLRGLMTIPPYNADDKELFQYYDQMNNLYSALKLDLDKKYGLELDTLSMGMSDDYVKAIAHGSTCVRIGTAFFAGLN